MDINVTVEDEGKGKRKKRTRKVTPDNGEINSGNNYDHDTTAGKIWKRFNDYIENVENKLKRNDFASALKGLKKGSFDVNNKIPTKKKENNKEEKPYSRTMLHEVAKHDKDPEFAKKLVCEHNADIFAKDNAGQTPLHEAAAADNVEVLRFLLNNLKERGYDIATKLKEMLNNSQQTPIHWAARFNGADAIRTIFEYIPKENVKDLINLKDKSKRTALFLAAEYARSDAASCLLDFDADPTVHSVDEKATQKKDQRDPGVMCLTFMIEKMEPVALKALQTKYYYQKDTLKREEKFTLDPLEDPFHLQIDRDKISPRTPLEAIIYFKRLKLIKNKVIAELINAKWKLFGRIYTWVRLFFDIIYVLFWSSLGFFVRWNSRAVYTFPFDGWRVFFYVYCSLATFVYIGLEIRHLYISGKRFHKRQEFRRKHLKDERKNLHPHWINEDKEFIENEIIALDKQKHPYFSDRWNLVDWISFLLVLTTVVTHIADVFTPRVPPCCPLSDSVACFNSSVLVCNDGKVNNNSLSLWNNRLMVLSIFVLWLRLVSHIRAIRYFGSFIALFSEMSGSVIRFIWLYLAIYFPFAIAFWMVFGAQSSIPSMLTVDRLFFTLYRMTVVDEYPYQEMLDFDFIMAYVLIGGFLAISAIILINLFIALLSDSFKRVYDQALANAEMEKAKLMLTIEDESLFDEQLQKCKKKFKAKYSPLVKPFRYDSASEDPNFNEEIALVRKEVNILRSTLENFHKKLSSSSK